MTAAAQPISATTTNGHQWRSSAGSRRPLAYTKTINTIAAMPTRPATMASGGRLDTAMPLNMNEDPHIATSANNNSQSFRVR